MSWRAPDRMSEDAGDRSSPAIPAFLWVTVFTAVLLGAVLRAVWIEDIEYKADEQWTFERTQTSGRTQPLPEVGMLTSIGIPNPWMSLGAFVGLARLAGAQDPPSLARAIEIANTGALVLLVLFAWRCVRVSEREAWLWAIALLALNPLNVLYDRKIWPPTILPLVVLALVAGWRYRDRS